MPAIRKPTEVLMLNGAFAKNKSRSRPVGPKSENPIGDPPGHLTAEERKVWRELVHNAPHDVLTATDRIILELAVRQTIKMRSGDATSNDLSLLSSSLSKLGWTPADRSKVISVSKPKGDDDLAFLN